MPFDSRVGIPILAVVMTTLGTVMLSIREGTIKSPWPLLFAYVSALGAYHVTLRVWTRAPRWMWILLQRAAVLGLLLGVYVFVRELLR